MEKVFSSNRGWTIGLDLGDRQSEGCVLDATGRIRERFQVRTRREAMRQRLGEYPASTVVLEVGTHSPWVSRELEALGHEAIVANAFTLGPRAALTGPVARGDVATVSHQMKAVAAAEPGWLADFGAAVQRLARLSGNGPLFEEMLQKWRRTDEEAG